MITEIQLMPEHSVPGAQNFCLTPFVSYFVLTLNPNRFERSKPLSSTFVITISNPHPLFSRLRGNTPHYHSPFRSRCHQHHVCTATVPASQLSLPLTTRPQFIPHVHHYQPSPFLNAGKPHRSSTDPSQKLTHFHTLTAPSLFPSTTQFTQPGYP